MWLDANKGKGWGRVCAYLLSLPHKSYVTIAIFQLSVTSSTLYGMIVLINRVENTSPLHSAFPPYSIEEMITVTIKLYSCMN